MLLAPLFKLLFSKTGLVIIAIFLGFSWFTGNNPLSLIGNLIGGSGGQTQSAVPYEGTREEDELANFSATILANTEDVWNVLLDDYREPTLVLFTGSISSACGSASSASGPFYCPGDEKLYLDLSFFQDMERQLNAPGDFAQAYVLAHEIGHHIQTLLGIERQVRELQQSNPRMRNEYSVAM